MSKSIGRTAIYARLHEGLFIHGAGELGKLFPAQGKTIEDLRMATSELGLLISGKRNGYVFEVLAPWPNVAQATLVPMEEPSVKKNSSADKAK